MPALIGSRRFALGLLASTALVVTPPALALPSGALSLHVMSDYSLADRGATGLTSGVVKNRLASTAPNKNLLSATRAHFTGPYYGGNMTVADGATAADGTTFAGKLSWSSGDYYFQLASPTFPAGSYVLSFDAISDDAASTYAMRAGPANTMTNISVGPTWSRFSVPFTLASAGGPSLCLPRTASGNSSSGAIRIDNVTIHQGSADLGRDTLAGHLYLGLDATRTAPGTATAGALDVSSGQGGVIQFPSTVNLSEYTVIAIGARTSLGSLPVQAALTKIAGGYTQFSAVMDSGGTAGGFAQNYFAGNQQISGDYPGLWLPRANEFHAITNRYGGGSASIFIDEAKTHNVASTGLTASIQSLWFSWINNTGLYSRYQYAAMALWPRALSDAEVRQAVAYMKTQVGSGVTVAPNPRFLLAEGDSITFGTGSTDGLGSYAMRAGVNLSPTVNGVDFAVPGSTLKDQGNGVNSLAARAAKADALIPANKNGRLYILTIMIGRNDINGYAGGTSQYISDLKAYAAARKAAGYDRIVLCTILPSTATGLNAARAPFNSTIRAAGWAAANGFDAIVDFDTVSGMGADTDASNTTNYPDGTHPSNAGYVLLEPAYRAVINALT